MATCQRRIGLKPEILFELKFTARSLSNTFTLDQLRPTSHGASLYLCDPARTSRFGLWLPTISRITISTERNPAWRDRHTRAPGLTGVRRTPSIYLLWPAVRPMVSRIFGSRNFSEWRGYAEVVVLMSQDLALSPCCVKSRSIKRLFTGKCAEIIGVNQDWR